MKKFIEELKCRLKTETPIWFKKIRRISVAACSAAIALLAADSWIHGFTLPELVHKICTYVIIAGISTGLVSTTAKVD